MSPRAARPARILLVVHSYYLRDTRPRRHAEALATAGHDVEVLCARDEGEPAEERHAGVLIRRLPARRRRGGKARYVFEYLTFVLSAAAAVARLHRRNRYDLVWILSIPNFVVFAGIVPRLMRCPVVLDVRDPMPEFFASRYGIGDDSPWLRLLRLEETLSLRFASHIVTVHETLREALLRSGVPRDRTTVIRNAPDLLRLGDPDPEARDPEDRTLLYAGTVASRYGVALGVEAVARLADEIPGIRLRVVGDGDHVRGLSELARRLGVADRVTFDGPRPFTDIPGIVRASWVGIQPHRDDPLMAFSLSTKVLEWCALQVPVVASRTPALAEALRDDEIAFIAPGNLDDLCDRLREIHKDPVGAAERAARAGAGVRERFRWDAEAETLLALVERLAR